MARVVEIASELIAVDTTNGNESLLLDRLDPLLSSLGFTAARVPVRRARLCNHPAYTEGTYGYQGRESGLYVLRGSDGTRSLLFNAHADVVPPGESRHWHTPPFQPTEQEGKLLGRGAADDKGGLAAFLAAVSELLEAGWVPGYDVVLEVTADEEGGGNGTLACLLDGVHPEAAVFIEPLGVRSVGIGHRGGLKFLVTTSSEGAQLQERGSGGAIEAMSFVLDGVREFAAERSALPPHPDYRCFPNARPVYLGRIDAGSWFSSAALACTLEGVIGWLPDEHLSELKERFAARIGRATRERGPTAATVSFPQHHIAPCKTELAERIVQVAAKAVRGILQEEPNVTCLNSGADMWIRSIHDRVPSILLGPGGGNCHGPNEFVWAHELDGCARIFREILLEW